ncbi:MAG TPA: aromatic ring-hydroxylating dioxygenase subunit alpha [Ramlibacter sp.]|nr:aromatic ring-hydroxylating dioxygenase subunit alpha [Ramlibacter sp.]
MLLATEPLVKNVWYMGAWSHEVQDKPLARRILGRPVVFFRGADGVVGALEDRCCHRAAPLSLGRVEGNSLQCGYHGLCFNAQGACVRVPGQDLIPPAARVPSFQVVEQDAVVWIWMGDADQADPSTIPRFPRHTEPAWRWRGSHFSYKADHLLLYDNLLDLTHVGYVHPHTIGGNEDEHSSAPLTVERGDRGAKGTRWMRDVDPPAAYTAVWPFRGRIDRCQVMRFQPGLVTISILAKDAGTLRHEEDAENAYESYGFHAVTPESEGSAHYFWSVGIPAALDEKDSGLLARKHEIARITFEEDRAVLEAQYHRMLEFPDRPVIAIRSDALSMAARRIWTDLAKAEKTFAQQE